MVYKSNIRRSRKRRSKSIRRGGSRRRGSRRRSRKRRGGSRRRSRRRGGSRRRSRKRRGSKRRGSKRRSRKRRSRRNSRKQNNKKVVMKFVTIKKSTNLLQPLTIYTAEGCPACADIIKLCVKKGIKYKAFDRRQYSEYVNKNTGNCRYVPNIFNSREEYLGGNDDVMKLMVGLKDSFTKIAI